MNRCIFVDWFHFNGKCPVRTCKFNTVRLDSGCMAKTLTATDNKKIVSDHELMYHKFSELNLAQVAAKRKEAILRVKKMLVLYEYIEFLKENCKLQKCDSPVLNELLSVFPFKLKKLSLSVEILYHVNDKTFAKFAEAKQLKEGFELIDVLFMTKKQWSDFLEKRKNEHRKFKGTHVK